MIQKAITLMDDDEEFYEEFGKKAAYLQFGSLLFLDIPMLFVSYYGKCIKTSTPHVHTTRARCVLRCRGAHGMPCSRL